MADSLFTLPFGKYRGVDIEDVPDSYLKWLAGEEWFERRHPRGRRAAVQELEYRERFDKHITDDH